MTRQSLLSDLISLSNRLGDPALDYAILAEGNTSVRVSDETFLIKASGASLQSAGAPQFVEVRFRPILELLQPGSLSDMEVRSALEGAMVVRHPGVVPSVESLLHAICLQLPGVSFVGHTHPTSINMLTCSRLFEESLSGRIFPDEIVLCGPASVLVPYVDPGLPLARRIADSIAEYRAKWMEPPRVIYMQNHGFIALGSSARQILDVTSMAVKSARIRVGAQAAGGLRMLSDADVHRIHTRPDEHHRQRILGLRSAGN